VALIVEETAPRRSAAIVQPIGDFDLRANQEGIRLRSQTRIRGINMTVDYQIYDLGDVKLQRGATIRDCKLAYKTFGNLDSAKSNVVVYLSWYSGQH